MIFLQCLTLYYVLVGTAYFSPTTGAYFSDYTYSSLTINNASKFKDSSSLASAKSWISCPKVYGSFVNNGGDMLVDTTWSVYKQIQGNNWSLIGTYPLKALKANETRILEYQPTESGVYRFVVEQVPTHEGNSEPKIETPYFDINKCQTN